MANRAFKHFLQHRSMKGWGATFDGRRGLWCILKCGFRYWKAQCMKLTGSFLFESLRDGRKRIARATVKLAGPFLRHFHQNMHWNTRAPASHSRPDSAGNEPIENVTGSRRISTVTRHLRSNLQPSRSKTPFH